MWLYSCLLWQFEDRFKHSPRRKNWKVSSIMHYRLRAIRGAPLGVVNLTPHFGVIQIFQILFLLPVSFYIHANICRGGYKTFLSHFSWYIYIYITNHKVHRRLARYRPPATTIKKPININKTTYHHPFIMADVKKPILGWDFLAKYRLNIQWIADKCVLVDKHLRVKATLVMPDVSRQILSISATESLAVPAIYQTLI